MRAMQKRDEKKNRYSEEVYNQYRKIIEGLWNKHEIASVLNTDISNCYLLVRVMDHNVICQKRIEEFEVTLWACIMDTVDQLICPE